MNMYYVLYIHIHIHIRMLISWSPSSFVLLARMRLTSFGYRRVG